jgi:O-antigen/teichoic acid export membrane protein
MQSDDRTDHAAPIHRAPRALALSFVNGLAARLGTLGIGIALARLLGPEEFGTYAVALVALMAAVSFNELGVSLAIVRWPDDPAKIAPTVATISIVASTIVAAVSFLLAPAFATAMGDPDATGATRLLALIIIINGFVTTPAALMQRQFMQGKRAIVDQVNVWVGAILSILLAIAGLGAVSLALGRLAGAAASGVLFVRFSPLPYRLGLDRRHVRPLLGFGLPLAGASIVVFAVSFADQLIVGHVLGATALGFYVLAFNLSSWPREMLSLPLRLVAPATFAALQHKPATMRRTLRGTLGVLSAVTFPICLVLAGAAEPVIRIVYGAAWAPAADALLWLAILAAFKIVFELAYDYLVVVGRGGAILKVQMATLVALVPAVYYGAEESGIAGAAAAQVAVAACVVLPLYLAVFSRAGLTPANILSRTWLPMLIALIVGVTALEIAERITSDIAAVLLAGMIGAVALAGLLYRDRKEIQQLRGSSLAKAAAGVEVPA